MSFDPTLSFNISRKLNPGLNGARLTEGPNGPGLMFGPVSIHDTANPMPEAEAWVERARFSRGDLRPSLALVFGLGLGYHLKALRRKYPGIKLLVFEPVADLKNLYEAHKVLKANDGEAAEIFVDWPEYEKKVSQEVVYGPDRSVLVMAPEGYKALRPEAFGAFTSFVEQEMIRRSVIVKTRENSDGPFLRNLASNAAYLSELPDLLLLKGLLPRRPAFIVGSGPSLSQNAAGLGGLGGRGLIITAASALKPLLEQGVSPDVVLILESGDTSSYLELDSRQRGILGENKILALASSCHPAHFKIEGFIKAVFHLTAGAAQVFSRGAFLPQGGNSGSAGFALAYVWGLEPLVLVGQDQAYADGRLHAEGTPGEVDDQMDGSLTIKGLNGGVVETNTGLLASIGWFAEAAKTIKDQGNAPKLFNCSAGGADIPGFTRMPLDMLVASLPPLNDNAGSAITDPAAAPCPERGFDLAAILPGLPRFSRSEIAADIDQLAAVVQSLRRLARLDYRKAYAEILEAGKLSKFLGQILAEAAVAAGRKELLTSLDKADGLMNLMRSSLGGC